MGRTARKGGVGMGASGGGEVDYQARVRSKKKVDPMSAQEFQDTEPLMDADSCLRRMPPEFRQSVAEIEYMDVQIALDEQLNYTTVFQCWQSPTSFWYGVRGFALGQLCRKLQFLAKKRGAYDSLPKLFQENVRWALRESLVLEDLVAFDKGAIPEGDMDPIEAFKFIQQSELEQNEIPYAVSLMDSAKSEAEADLSKAPFSTAELDILRDILGSNEELVAFIGEKHIEAATEGSRRGKGVFEGTGEKEREAVEAARKSKTKARAKEGAAKAAKGLKRKAEEGENRERAKKAEKQVEEKRTRAEQEERRAEEESKRAEEEKLRADKAEAALKAVQDKLRKAEQAENSKWAKKAEKQVVEERTRAEQEEQRAKEESERAEKEKLRADKAEAALKAAQDELRKAEQAENSERVKEAEKQVVEERTRAEQEERRAKEESARAEKEKLRADEAKAALKAAQDKLRQASDSLRKSKKEEAIKKQLM